ncbi:MAG: hypothetical protein IBJ18_00790 [Phycisphaerales bacterium]|nr:hypothetical protein [Phycisphaerales bacterium]
MPKYPRRISNASGQHFVDGELIEARWKSIDELTLVISVLDRGGAEFDGTIHFSGVTNQDAINDFLEKTREMDHILLEGLVEYERNKYSLCRGLEVHARSIYVS